MNEWTQLLNGLVVCGLFYAIWWVASHMMPRSTRFLAATARRAGQPVRTQAKRRGWLFALMVPICGGLGLASIVIGWAENDVASILGGLVLVLIAWIFLRLFSAHQRLKRGRTALPGRPRHRPSSVFRNFQRLFQRTRPTGMHGSQVPLQTINIWLAAAGIVYYALSYFLNF